MEIWLDTLNQTLIHDASTRGALHGVTTNPSIIGRSQEPLEEVLEKLLDIQDGPVAVQVMANDAEEMIRQAEMLIGHSLRVIVKVPASSQGLLAINTLTSNHIPVMATAIFDPYQALLALKAGAHYIAVYTSRIEESGAKAKDVLNSIQLMIENFASQAKIIAAGIKSKELILFCAEQRIGAVTLNEKMYQELTQEHPGTMDAMERFDKDWQQGKGGFY